MSRRRIQFKLPALFALMALDGVACVWVPWALSTPIELVVYITIASFLGIAAFLAIIGSRD
jgi:hypothetical protein